MIYHSSFYPTQASRDAAYHSMRGLLDGDDHGVSGGTKNPFSGKSDAWQVWATLKTGDAKAIDAAAKANGASLSVTR